MFRWKAVTQSVGVAATEQVPLDVTLGVGPLVESVTVIADARALSQSVQTGTTFRQELLSSLPGSRTLAAAVIMAPNVKTTGPGGTSGSGSSPRGASARTNSRGRPS